MQLPGRIAIDGPAGSGKSTIGEQLARRLGYLYIDTGAMYRAVTWLALKEGVDVHDEAALERLARHAEIVIDHPQVQDGRQYTVTVRGQDITWDIRSSAVTSNVSVVSAHPAVRAILIAGQRAMANQSGVVMVGRDIGSVVLPDAELKIYLIASLEERARRRYAELVERNSEPGQDIPSRASRQLPSLEKVLSEIAQRDEIDRDNMRPAADAVIITTDHLSVPQVLAVIDGYLESRA